MARRDGALRWALGVCLVLAAPGAGFVSRYLANTGCQGALNLDGGPSTGLAWRDGGKVNTLPPRGPVRHAVVFRAR